VASNAPTQRFSATEQFVLQAMARLMEQIDAREAVNVYHDGLVQLLYQPEFQSMERARAIVEVLERPHVLRELLPEMPGDESVRVLIGSDNRWDWMRECAVVLARYGAAGELSGVVGVFGPLRLSYGVAIPAVRHISRIMTELLDDPSGLASAGRTPREDTLDS
jgi:heat-inducible transcriptional repressor